MALLGGVQITGFLSPTASGDTYATHDALYGRDGLRNVDLLSDLDNIPADRRRAGMIVGVGGFSGFASHYTLLPEGTGWTYTIADWGLAFLPASATTALISGSTGPFEYNTGTTSGIQPKLGSNDSTAEYSVIGGGSGNTLNSKYSFIGGGHNNVIDIPYTNAYNSNVIVGGHGHTITAPDGYYSGMNFIGGGGFYDGSRGNTINNGYASVIVGGGAWLSGNQIGGPSGYSSPNSSFIGAGDGNYIQNSYGFIGAGQYNRVSGETSSIVGGSGNGINGNYSFIGGGQNNYIDRINNSFIGVGQNNVIGPLAYRSAIITGDRNEVLGNDSVIGGGQNNSIYGRDSFIGSGRQNAVNANMSAIPAGQYNTIGSNFGFIGAGTQNTIHSGSSYSTIIGGKLNDVNHTNTHIIGSNITSVSADTTHVERLNIGTLDTGSTATEVLVREANGMVNTTPLSGLTGGTGSSKYVENFAFTAATTSTITHNLGDLDVIVQVKDASGQLITPNTVDNYTTNSVDINVSATETMRVIIIA